MVSGGLSGFQRGFTGSLERFTEFMSIPSGLMGILGGLRGVSRVTRTPEDLQESFRGVPGGLRIVSGSL